MASPLNKFLDQSGWHFASIDWFSADWSVRSYARLTKENGETAILLQSPPDHSPEAQVGHMIGAWSKINKHFKSLNLNVPTILAEDLDAGFIVMEDFGNETIAGHGMDAYLEATDILITMRNHPNALDVDLIKYEETHVYKALRFFPQYVTRTNADDWFAAWKDIENTLPPCPRALTHMDFAPQNLMWASGKIGIIDFQATCDGPFVYDIVNLLEDIRIDVPDDIKQECKKLYRATLSPDSQDLFDAWYQLITAQFHARVLGQIKFLAQEKGRDDLMKYYDPLMSRLKKEIENDLLTPIRKFF